MGIEIRPKGLVDVQLRWANIGQDYWEQDFSTFKGPKGPKDVSIKYLKNLEEMKDRGVGILYVGPNGPGKTTLAMIVMKYLVRANWDVFCTSLGEVVERIQKSWNATTDESHGEFLGYCREANFLFIDDVGKEHRGASGFVQTVFDNLIRHRVQHRSPTFLTTNLTKSELEGTYGESVMSLLEGKLIPVTVDGADYRKTELKKEARQILNGS